MLIKLLPNHERVLLLNLARLLALSDKPLMWEGKTKDELTADSSLSALSIQQGALESDVLADLENATGSEALPSLIEWELTEKLKNFPLSKIDLPESRVEAANAVLADLLEGKKAHALSTPKIMLFQLLLIALRDGKISSIEWSLLKGVQRHYQLQDFIFDDLLERAEALNSEISKTIALVLE